ncbi:hypothetical protein C0991_011949, partial [Blastosporella zonata]
TDSPPEAFTYPWLAYTRLVPAEFLVNNEAEAKSIIRIQQLLMRPFDPEVPSAESLYLSEGMLRKKLMGYNRNPLRFICYSLNLLKNKSAKTKLDFVDLLIAWVCRKKASY